MVGIIEKQKKINIQKLFLKECTVFPPLMIIRTEKHLPEGVFLPNL